MKPCTYCGRENEDNALHCGGCGTEIATADDETERVGLLSSRGFRTFVTIVAVMFLGATLYLLSFGPVFRWTATVTTTPTPPAVPITSTNGTTVVYSKRISIPGWVGVVYYPAFALMSGRAGTLGDLYHRYIEWWEVESQ